MILLAKNGTPKINLHDFEDLFQKHLQIMVTLLEKVKIVFWGNFWDIFMKKIGCLKKSSISGNPDG